MQKATPVETSSSWLEEGMKRILVRRAEKGSLRVYQELSHDDDNSSSINNHESQQRLPNLDFSSNDYLGLARDYEQKRRVDSRYQSLLKFQQQTHQDQQPSLGATGSRLLSGDSSFARQLEQRLALWHNRPAALLFNSGYDANVAVMSCLPCDIFLFDEYAHNSLRMGMRLSQSAKNHNHANINQTKVLGAVEESSGASFQHNCVKDLRRKLETIQTTQHHKSNDYRVLIVVESVYSMDGDVAPLKAMLDLAYAFGALVLVDEAHGIGIFGNESRGTGVLTQLGLEGHPALAGSIHTFGKAAGCHGAVVCGSVALRQYLWNYGWPLIYSTSLPLHSLVAIECSYETMTSPRGKVLRKHTQDLVYLFRRLLQARLRLGSPGTRQNQNSNSVYLLPSTSPIQALVLPTNGNQACTEFCLRVWQISQHTLRLYPIKSPTVPEGMERIRIILHGHNTTAEVYTLVECIRLCLKEMKLLEHHDDSGGSIQPTGLVKYNSRL